jgi:hypothetical protein
VTLVLPGCNSLCGKCKYEVLRAHTRIMRCKNTAINKLKKQTNKQTKKQKNKTKKTTNK